MVALHRPRPTPHTRIRIACRLPRALRVRNPHRQSQHTRGIRKAYLSRATREVALPPPALSSLARLLSLRAKAQDSLHTEHTRSCYVCGPARAGAAIRARVAEEGSALPAPKHLPSHQHGTRPVPVDPPRRRSCIVRRESAARRKFIGPRRQPHPARSSRPRTRTACCAAAHWPSLRALRRNHQAPVRWRWHREASPDQDCLSAAY